MSEENSVRNETSPAEILRMYQAGVRLFENIELEEGASLRGQNLRSAHFKNAWLHSTDFSNADLRGAVFENSNVKCVDFCGSDLRSASFVDVALCGSDFSGANVDNTNLQRAEAYGASVTDLCQLQS
jgi:uncharacterized protein YjbI with pentapeptide repeats